MSNFIPNSFQHPNVYIDQLSYYLTPAEEKVLNKAIREIYGWQDKIANRRARISLSVFTDGKRAEDGTILCRGCGLSSQAVRDALASLDEFGILRKIGRPNVNGQMFEIQDDDSRIDWAGLEARKDVADERGRSAAARARDGKDKADEVLAANTPISGYDPSVLPANMPDLLGRSNKETQETQLETQLAAAVPSTPPGEKKRRKPAAPAREKDPPPKAVAIFRANTNYYPPKSWYADIAATVGTEPGNLEFWAKIIKRWVGLGWKPTNVAGMLDHYRRRELPGDSYGNGKSPPPAQSTVRGI